MAILYTLKVYDGSISGAGDTPGRYAVRTDIGGIVQPDIRSRDWLTLKEFRLFGPV